MNTTLGFLYGLFIGADILVAAFLLYRHGLIMPFTIPVVGLLLGAGMLTSGLVRRIRIEEAIDDE